MSQLPSAVRLPAKSTNNGAHPHAVRGDDLYPTPSPLTRALLEHETFPRLIWEPAAGRGDMAAPLTEAGHHVYQSDLVDYGTGNLTEGTQDFFACTEAPWGISTIITNPPFKVGGAFVRHGLKLCGTVAILNRLMFLEGRGRSDVLDTNLARILVFKERPPMMHRWSQDEHGNWREWTGKKASSAMPFAWFIFKSQYNAAKQGTQIKRISWRPHA